MNLNREKIINDIIEKKYTDCIIEINGEKFKYHRIILVNIPYFQALFRETKPDIYQEDNSYFYLYKIEVPFENLNLVLDFSYQKYLSFDDIKDINDIEIYLQIFNFLIMETYMPKLFVKFMELKKPSLNIIKLFLESVCSQSMKNCISDIYAPIYPEIPYNKYNLYKKSGFYDDTLILSSHNEESIEYIYKNIKYKAYILSGDELDFYLESERKNTKNFTVKLYVAEFENFTIKEYIGQRGNYYFDISSDDEDSDDDEDKYVINFRKVKSVFFDTDYRRIDTSHIYYEIHLKEL